ncbi:MAG: hypothetical protein HKM03_02675 [Steroidobacteraceae bacterium]|jgi:chemotaxis receptor (MCP) glutamine deamidase CheD|nr:hypothetical protein [Steroidobacteraceae bacterium]
MTQIEVEADAYHTSPEPILLAAELKGALALCLRDERRAVGGLLHLRCGSSGARACDVTDNTLSAVLLVLARFKRAILGNATRREDVHARIIAHTFPAKQAEPDATIVDLIRADLADARLDCAVQMLHGTLAVRVRFEPFGGQLWIADSNGTCGFAACAL